MIVCEECGCDKVQTVMWVEINTNTIIDGANSNGEDDQDNWCPNCNAHCSITDELYYNNENDEEE